MPCHAPKLAPPRHVGLTLVEMIIVVMIIAIAAALAVPQLGNTASSKLSAAASMFVADVGFAQVECMSHSEDLRVLVFDNASDTYHIAAASDTATPITNPITHQAYLIDYDTVASKSLQGVTIDSYSLGGDDELSFNVYGALDQATDATITLGCDGMSVTVTVDADTGECIIGAMN